MFWTPGLFPSFIFSLKTQYGRIIQQPTRLYMDSLYMGFCNSCLFLSIAKGVTLVAGRVSGNNQWIPSQNKGANVVPSSWVNKQLLNKIFSTALHVCVNIVFPPWVIWSAALQLHGRSHHFLQLSAEDRSFVSECNTQDFLWATGVAFFGRVREKSQVRKSWWAYLRGRKDMKQMLFVPASGSIS